MKIKVVMDVPERDKRRSFEWEFAEGFSDVLWKELMALLDAHELRTRKLKEAQ